MTATYKPETDAITMLMRAIDRLDAAGYSCWLLEEFSVEHLFVCLDGIPSELPLLLGEIELLASAHDELMRLGDWDDASSPQLSKSAL